jgi:hypothetical protein
MDGLGANSVEAFQAKLNRSTRRQWDWYASHRRELHALLASPGLPAGGRLCVLGAGNCNDIHLPTLADRFDEIHLADIDGPAVARAVERQAMKGSAAIRVHGGVDLSGAAAALSSRSIHPPTSTAIDACLAAINEPAAPFAVGFDALLSPCVLSQIIRSAAMAVGDGHPRFPELLIALRRRHLRTVADLLKPGGYAVVAIDLVSTETLPELRDAEPAEWAGLMEKVLNTGNFFSGLAPASVLPAAENTAVFDLIRQTRPWRWRLGERRAYLVYGVILRRAAAPRSSASRSASAGAVEITGRDVV